MAFDVGAVVGRLEMNIKGWKDSVKTVKEDQKSLSGFALRHEDGIKKLGKSLALAGGAATAAFGLMIKGAADAGDNINDLSQRTGIATETLSGYKLAADKSGTSLEGFATGMRGLSNQMDAANRGGADAVGLFNTLGVSFKNADGSLRPLNDVFLDVADRLSKMPDGAQKTALAMDAFGRSGMDLIPMLNMGRDGLQENYDITEKLNGIWRKDAAEAAAKFKDKLDELKTATNGAGKEISVALMPVVGAFVDMAKNAAASVGTWAREHPGLTKVIGATVLGAAGLATAIGPVLLALPGLVKGLQALKTTAAAPIVFTIAFAVALPILTKAASDFNDELKNMRDSMREEGSSGFISFLEGVNSGFRRVFLGIKDSNISMSEANTQARLFAREGGRGAADILLEVKDKAEDAKPPLDGLGGSVKTLKEELGLTFRSETEDRIKKLNQALIEYRGKLTADEVKRIYEEIATLTEKLGGWKPNAEEAARAVTGMLDDIVAKIDEVAEISDQEWSDFTDGMQKDFEDAAQKDIPAHLKGIPAAVQQATSESKGYFDGLFNDIAQGFGNTIQEWLSGATTFKDFMKGLWGDIKDAFFTVIGEMVAEWTVNFVKKLIGDAADVGASIAKNVGGALGGVGSAAGSMAGSFLTAASSVANIVTAVASVISLFKKAPTGAGDGMGRVVERQDQQTSLLTIIKDFCWNDIHVGLLNLGRIMDSVTAGGWTNNWLKKIDTDILGVKAAILGVPGAAEGLTLTSPGLVMTHGTPSLPEYIVPSAKMGAMGPGGGGKIEVHVHVEGQVITDRDYFRKRVIPEMTEAARAGLMKAFQESMVGA